MDGKLVESLMPMLAHNMNLKRCLTTTRDDGSSPDGGADLGRWECSIAPGVDIEKLRNAWRIAEQYVNRQSSTDIVTQALYALRQRTKIAAEDSGDIENRTVAYVTELTRYPPDVIVEGCKRIAREQTFFPALSEIVKTCDRLMDKRRSILTAIEIAGRKATARQQPEARNTDLDDLRNDPCWIEWMRQVNDNPLTVKPWGEFQKEWAA